MDHFEAIEQRRYPRRRVMQNIQTLKGDKGNDEYIVDISAGGCCIKTPVLYMRGDRVVIIFKNEKSIIGKVVWQKSEEYGVRFLKCQMS
jgi:hypothetical protein